MSSLEYPQQVFWMLLFLLGGGAYQHYQKSKHILSQPNCNSNKEKHAPVERHIINIIYKINFLFREKGLSEPNAIMLTLVRRRVCPFPETGLVE